MLLFCPATIQPRTDVYSAFCAVYANYTAHAAKQRTGLCRRFPSYLPCFAAAVWRVHPAIPHRLRHAGRCTGQRSRPIIIRYIRVQRCAPLLWIHAKQCSISQTMPARRGLDASHTWHGISLALAWHGSAEPLAAAAVSLFGLSPDSQ